MSRKRAASIACIALAIVAVFALSSCRPTDFFTEIIISPLADVVDEDNENVTTINSPDADEESDMLSALDWTDESLRSEAVENLVVYSSDPTTDYNTRNSIFDLYPLLEGAEASLGVRLLYADEADVDAQANTWLSEQEETDAESTSASQVESEETLDAQSEEAAEESEAETTSQDDEGSAETDSGAGGTGDEGDTTGAGSDETGSGDTTGTGGDSGGDESGSGSSDTDSSGTRDEPWAGLSGDVDEYEPNNAFSKVNSVDSVAVIGTQVAVIAQAIGGNGAICAMSEDAYYGTDEDRTLESFESVFTLAGDIDADEFEESVLLWENDGTSSDDVTDIEALAEACGQDGVVVYDQDLGDQYTFFSTEQRQVLQYYDIQMVPVDFSTLQGLLDCVAVIGDALADSETCEQDAEAQADAYWDAVDSIVVGVADTHDGVLAGASVSSTSSADMLTTYNNCPVNVGGIVGDNGWAVVCHIATEVATSWNWTSSSTDIDTSVLLFETSYTDGSLSHFWCQVAGTRPGASSTAGSDNAGSAEDIDVLWPYTNSAPTALSGSGELYNRWLSSTTEGISSSNVDPMSAGPTNAAEGQYIFTRYGLGSKLMPYLVVSATEDCSAAEVRELVCDSLGSYVGDGVVSAYSVLPYGEDDTEAANIPQIISTSYRSTIGSTNASTSESPFFTGLDYEDVVRENPTGLLGSWTGNTFECVLEAIWLGELYSYCPDGCSYIPVNDFSEFSCTIGDEECTTLQEAVTAFYGQFYRLSASEVEACYDDVVTDQLEDLADDE